MVKASLVKQEQYTDKTKLFKYINGSREWWLVTLVDIDSPHFKGRAEAVCMKELTYEVVIRNVKGTVQQNFESIQAVQTRAHSNVK